MRNSLILLCLCYSLTISGTTYYIDPSGSDSNSGSGSSPWKTLAYGCSKVTTPGDIIHVNAGTYTEIAQSVLAVGVSIEGVGNTSIIHSNITVAYTHTILLSSSSEGTNGNQSISYIRMEGGMNAYGAIRIEKRKNVSVHHCEFEDFFSRGIMFTGAGYGSDSEPTTYATGNTFHDNIVTNCATYVGSGPSGAGLGNLEIGGQSGMLIYNNTIVQEDRGSGVNGFCIKYTSNGYCKGLKIYNNTISKPPYDGVTWDFSMELWNCRGGIEIYNNNIQGCIDFGGNTSLTNDAGGYGFAAKVYNNSIGQSALRTREENGIDIERGQTGGFYIYNNLFKNLTSALIMYQGNGDTFKDFYVYYNIFNTIGISGQTVGNAIDWGTIDLNNITYDNINFLNNTIYAGTGGTPLSGLRFDFRGNATNITIRNNIIQGFKAYPIYMQATGTISTVFVENNLYYGNGTNAASYATTTTNKTEQNNLVSNPLFVSLGTDFHLTSNSPAIGKGIHITAPAISTDYTGSALKNPPSIGAYESGSAASAPAVPVYQSSAVANATPSLLEMTYNMTLANIVPAASSFSVLVNSVSRTVNTVAVSGTRVQMTLSSRIVSGDIVTVSYIIPSNNPIQTTSSGIAASIANQQVINNCINIAPTAVITSPGTNGSFTAPANITITANALDTDGSVSLVEFYNGNTKLGSNTAAPYSFTWNNVAEGNYSLTVIATDNLNAKTTSSVISITVVNNINATNKHPIVRIYNPRKGTTYDNLSTIEIDATASDPDGTISKVEFYNGETELVELTSAPYTYIWKDVAAGSYSITAIATDNVGDTTKSSPVEFEVGSTVQYDAKSDIINLYPNPNNGHFSIEFINPLQSEKGEIVITDLAGKQIYNGPVLKEEILKQFDLSDSRSGMYVLMIKDKEILVTKKFIKN